MGLGVLLRKELREQLRTNRFIAVVAVFVLFGILGPLTDRYMKELIDAIGSQSGGFSIEVPPPSLAGDLVQIDEVHSGQGYQSHFGMRLHFGLGKHDRIDRLEVRWIGGGTELFEGVPVDRIVTLTEGTGKAVAASLPPSPGK